jgi:hypothetical protein
MGGCLSAAWLLGKSLFQHCEKDVVPTWFEMVFNYGLTKPEGA